MNRTIFRSTFLILIIVFTLGTLVFAQDANPPTISDDEVNAIAKQLYCPVCENIPLDVCGTQACAQWRELIREKLSEEWGEDEIKEYFVLHYGDRVLAEPPLSGLNWLVYIVPPTAFLVGIYILFRPKVKLEVNCWMITLLAWKKIFAAAINDQICINNR